jgi:hypothetical protein
MEARSGVLPHLMATKDTILLHLLADVGNKTKHLRIREEFESVEDVKVKIRVPQSRRAKGIMQLRSGFPLFDFAQTDGWVNVTVPKIHIHEVLQVDLA